MSVVPKDCVIEEVVGHCVCGRLSRPSCGGFTSGKDCLEGCKAFAELQG